MLQYLPDFISGKIGLVDILIIILLTIPIVLIALTFHEYAHGWVAYKLGDPTAKSLGRLTLNPIKHFHPIGMLMMFLVGIGWANPVPINVRNFKNPKKGMAISAAAGPVMNLILGFFGIFVYCLILKLVDIKIVSYSLPIYVLCIFFYNFFYMNVRLAVFNMIPIPPFDGSRVLFAFLPDRQYFALMKYERVIMFVVLIAVATGVLDLPLNFITNSFIWVMEWLVNIIL